MAKRAEYQWVFTPGKAAAPKISAQLKAEVTEKGNTLVERVLKPTYIKPVPADHQFNYVSNLYTKWLCNYFYFCAEYTCPGPNAISPTFESKFARLTYTGNDRFTLSAQRHNDQWMELYPDQTLDECLAAIQSDPWFHA